MVRSYSEVPVPDEVLERVLDAALHGPSAGFTQGVDLLVLESPTERHQFFELTSDPGFLIDPGAAAGLLRAPVIVVPLSDPGAYLTRYGEPDKARSGLGGLAQEAWPVPYWLVDTSFAVMLALLAATDAGLGALFFRLHRDPGLLLETFGVPEDRQVIGAIALGYEEEVGRQGAKAVASPARRPRRQFHDAVHRSHW
jgi:nitroreductase